MKSMEEIRKIINLRITKEGQDGFHALWTDPVTQRVYSIILSWGGGWEHFSITPVKNDKTPTWEFMCKMKEYFFKDDEACVEYHPKKEDYVDQLHHCLHIWRPIDQELPCPPAIFVGLGRKGDSE